MRPRVLKKKLKTGDPSVYKSKAQQQMALTVTIAVRNLRGSIRATKHTHVNKTPPQSGSEVPSVDGCQVASHQPRILIQLNSRSRFPTKIKKRKQKFSQILIKFLS